MLYDFMGHERAIAGVRNFIRTWSESRDHAALQDAERSAPESGDFLVRFSKQRDKFERIASRKHGRGQIEEDGSIVVHRSDIA